MTLRAQKSEPVDLTVMIPCKNNIRTIGRVLDSVQGLASQLVIVDSGSTDGTLEIIQSTKQWAELVLIQTHWRGFVRTSSMALNASNRKYTLWIDSDEPITKEMATSIRKAIADNIPAAKFQRVVEYNGRLLKHSWQPEWRTRLIRMDLVHTNQARITGINPHNHLQIDKPHKTHPFDGVLIHNSFDTFSEHLENQLRLAHASAISLHALGRDTTALKMALSPLWSFFKQAFLKGSWRDGRPGWLAASTTSAGTLMKHMILYELRHNDNQSPPPNHD